MFGNVIKAIRTVDDISRCKMADKLSILKDYLRKIEKNEKIGADIKARVISQIINIYGFSFYDLDELSSIDDTLGYQDLLYHTLKKIHYSFNSKGYFNIDEMEYLVKAVRVISGLSINDFYKNLGYQAGKSGYSHEVISRIYQKYGIDLYVAAGLNAPDNNLGTYQKALFKTLKYCKNNNIKL